jgi:hypothetical protein
VFIVTILTHEEYDPIVPLVLLLPKLLSGEVRINDDFQARPPREADRLLWWRWQHGNETRYVLALVDFSYIVVVADRGEFVLPWTAYCVDREHRRVKLRKEYDEYWRAQNC